MTCHLSAQPFSGRIMEQWKGTRSCESTSGRWRGTPGCKSMPCLCNGNFRLLRHAVSLKRDFRLPRHAVSMKEDSRLRKPWPFLVIRKFETFWMPFEATQTSRTLWVSKDTFPVKDNWANMDAFIKEIGKLSYFRMHISKLIAILINSINAYA